jgi:hypothetical protein
VRYESWKKLQFSDESKNAFDHDFLKNVFRAVVTIETSSNKLELFYYIDERHQQYKAELLYLRNKEI